MKADEGVRGRVKAVMAATVFVAVRWHISQAKQGGADLSLTALGLERLGQPRAQPRAP